MKCVVALDSFKECMTAKNACEAVKRGVHHYDETIEVRTYPLADGGEGTLETLVDALHGVIEYYRVTGPLGESVEAPIGYCKDLAIIECAKVCGLEMLTEEQKNPYQTTTYGLGELMKIACQKGSKRLFICLGGSATNDGGIGMLSALGVDFHFNHDVLTMNDLKNIQSIDLSHLESSLKDIDIVGVCDVDNPLCGVNGATYVYAKQKGLKETEFEVVDKAMAHYGELVDALFNHDYRNEAGAGAAGGLGYALMSVCQASIRPGFQLVSETLQLEDAMHDVDFAVVGEGRMDSQTLCGKTPFGVMSMAKKYNKSVFGFAGCIFDQDILLNNGFDRLYEISPRDMELSEALRRGEELLEKCVYEHMKEMIG